MATMQIETNITRYENKNLCKNWKYVKSRSFWLIRALASFVNRLHRLCDFRLILPDRVTYIKHKTNKLMFGQRHRWWTDLTSELAQCLGFAGFSVEHQ